MYSAHKPEESNGWWQVVDNREEKSGGYKNEICVCYRTDKQESDAKMIANVLNVLQSSEENNE